MNKTLKIILWILGIAIGVGIIVLLIQKYWGDKTISESGTETITNSEYQNQAKIAKEFFNELNPLAEEASTSKIDWASWTSKVLQIFQKHPQVAIYAWKFIGAPNKEVLIGRGIAVAADGKLKPEIAQRSLALNQPVWVSMVDKTFEGV